MKKRFPKTSFGTYEWEIKKAKSIEELKTIICDCLLKDMLSSQLCDDCGGNSGKFIKQHIKMAFDKAAKLFHV